MIPSRLHKIKSEISEIKIELLTLICLAVMTRFLMVSVHLFHAYCPSTRRTQGNNYW